MSEELATGYTCPNCETFHKFPAYVYAHWDFTLNTTCTCKARFQIFRGEATRLDEPKDAGKPVEAAQKQEVA